MVLPMTAPFPVFYEPKHFRIEELVSKRIFQRLKLKGLPAWAWKLFDVRLLKTLDALRQAYGGKIIVNDWSMGGHLNQCGLRMDDTSQGAVFSQHRFGRAADLRFEKTASDQVRNDCLAQPWSEPFRFITCIEAGVSWFHFDVRNHDKENDGVLVVKPA